MTPKQDIFIKEYIISRNATQSYINAGFSPKFAHSNAPKLLQNTAIKSRIDAEFERIAEQYKFTEQDVYEGLGTIAKNGMVEANRLSAWVHIGKALAMFKDTSVNVSIFQNLDKTKLQKAREALKSRRSSKK